MNAFTFFLSMSPFYPRRSQNCKIWLLLLVLLLLLLLQSFT
jgi:hypothetical protein